MKKLYLFLFVAIAAVSCSQKIDKADLIKLNGYWEIEEVVMPDGEKKEYKVNPTIDFFVLSDGKGFRQKVMPLLEGGYRTNGLREKMTVTEEDNKTYIAYKTDHAEWKEQILEVNEEKLVVKNEQDIEYHYKREKPFSNKK